MQGQLALVTVVTTPGRRENRALTDVVCATTYSLRPCELHPRERQATVHLK
jgi:hypothetical protein